MDEEAVTYLTCWATVLAWGLLGLVVPGLDRRAAGGRWFVLAAIGTAAAGVCLSIAFLGKNVYLLGCVPVLLALGQWSAVRALVVAWRTNDAAADGDAPPPEDDGTAALDAPAAQDSSIRITHAGPGG